METPRIKEFEKKVQAKKDALKNDLVDAYEQGINDFGEELTQRLVEEKLKRSPAARIGLNISIQILSEYGC